MKYLVILFSLILVAHKSNAQQFKAYVKYAIKSEKDSTKLDTIPAVSIKVYLYDSTMTLINQTITTDNGLFFFEDIHTTKGSINIKIENGIVSDFENNIYVKIPFFAKRYLIPPIIANKVTKTLKVARNRSN